MSEKVTMKEFANALEEKYGSAAGARRAVGRFLGWDDAEKKKAHRMINKKFGASASATTAVAPSAPSTTPKRRGRPPKVKPELEAAPVAKKENKSPKVQSGQEPKPARKLASASAALTVVCPEKLVKEMKDFCGEVATRHAQYPDSFATDNAHKYIDAAARALESITAVKADGRNIIADGCVQDLIDGIDDCVRLLRMGLQSIAVSEEKRLGIGCTSVQPATPASAHKKRGRPAKVAAKVIPPVTDEEEEDEPESPAGLLDDEDDEDDVDESLDLTPPVSNIDL